MSPEVYGVQPGEHIPGAVLHRYLTDYAKKFGVFSRTQFNTKAETLQPSGAGWSLSVSSDGEQRTLKTKKIIIATGLTSQPNFPVYPGAETFEAPHFHVRDFCRNAETVKTAQNVVVVGGAKSAIDTAYAYADNGAHVDMVIRKNGNGPIWISYPWVLGGKKRLEKLLSVRFLTWFSPCIFGGLDGWGWVRNFLHGTSVGRFFVDTFWKNLGGEVIDVNGYASDPELKKLQPWNPAFWIGSGLSIHNYENDFFQMVKKGKVNVHVTDVDRLTKGTVHLADGTALDADVLVCATGWKKNPSITLGNLATGGIGLPLPPVEQHDLAAAADKQVLDRFPKLRNQPKLNFDVKSDPFRMYRYMIPPAYMEKRNIAFAGMVSSVSTATAANAQAMWISTFFDNRLDIIAKTPQEVAKEVMLHTQWNKWRHPTGYGASFPDFAFDALPYIDLLIKDLGLKVNRHKGTWAEVFHPYGPRDFVGLADEWRECH